MSHIRWTIGKNYEFSSLFDEPMSIVDRWVYCLSRCLGLIQSRLNGINLAVIMHLLTVELKRWLLSQVVILECLAGITAVVWGSFFRGGVATLISRSVSCF